MHIHVVAQRTNVGQFPLEEATNRKLADGTVSPSDLGWHVRRRRVGPLSSSIAGV